MNHRNTILGVLGGICFGIGTNLYGFELFSKQTWGVFLMAIAVSMWAQRT